MRATGPGQSALLLLDTVDVLASRHIDYAAVGALAASVHGAVRASLDADALLSISMREAGELAAALKHAGFLTTLKRGDLDDPVPALLAVEDFHSNRVDLLFGLRGFEPAGFRRAIDIAFQGARLRVVGREDFIAMKAFAGGAQDLVDARRAIDADVTTLDKVLVRRLADRYGRTARAALDQLLPG